MRQDSEQPVVKIRGGLKGDGVLAFTVDNTCTQMANRNRSGDFMSTKHSGKGIGTESVREIVGRYNGIVEFANEPGLFCVSVMMYLKANLSKG